VKKSVLSLHHSFDGVEVQGTVPCSLAPFVPPLLGLGGGLVYSETQQAQGGPQLWRAGVEVTVLRELEVQVVHQ